MGLKLVTAPELVKPVAGQKESPQLPEAYDNNDRDEAGRSAVTEGPSGYCESVAGRLTSI